MDDKWIYLIPLIIIILGGQGFWIFQDARKRGEKLYWLWGLFGLIQFPTSLIIYYLVTRTLGKREDEKESSCPGCHRKVKEDWSYCPYCGEPLQGD